MVLQGTKPKYKRVEFIQNNTRPNIYDIAPQSEIKLCDYIELTEPKAEQLKANGATKVIEGYKREKREIFSGLKPYHKKKVFFGDHYHNATKKKSFMIIKIAGTKITILYFKNRYVPPAGARRFIDMYVY